MKIELWYVVSDCFVKAQMNPSHLWIRRERVLTLDFPVRAETPEITPDDVFKFFNVKTGEELPVMLGLRSLSTGDVVLFGDDFAYLCDHVGWKEGLFKDGIFAEGHPVRTPKDWVTETFR